MLQSHFRGTAITRATHLNWKERLRARPISLCLSMSPVHPVGERDEETSPLFFFFFFAPKSGSLSLRDGAKLQKAHVIEQT